MKSIIQPCLLVGVFFLFTNFSKLESLSKEIPNATRISNTKSEKSFWNTYTSQWHHLATSENETLEFSMMYYNNSTVIANKKISRSTDDSYEDNKGDNEPEDPESGNIRWKGYRFTDLNIPANATIDNVKLTLYGYKHGNTTVNIKAENLKSPSTYDDDDDYLSSRNTTSKSVNWSVPKLKNGLEITSPNLKDVVQAVVNAKGGITHLSLIISSSKKWECWNFDDRYSSFYPKIDISYTLAEPIANDDNITIDENTKAIVKIFDNDKNIPTNANFWVHKTPRNGFITPKDINNTPNDKSDDVLEYTPNQNYDGTDSFEYTVCDNRNNCDRATVNVTVNSVVDPCDAAASGNLDTDKDGIADICDLDDDNDGILDEDECPEVTPFTFKLNSNNKQFTNSGRTGDEGDIMLYRRIGSYNGNNIDLRLTVVKNSDPSNMTVDISGFKFGSDLYPVLLGGSNKQENPYATIKFEFLKSGTNQLLNVSPSFMFKDIDYLSDGTGESVEINKNIVSSYSFSKNPATKLYQTDNVEKDYAGNSGSFIRFNSKAESGGLDNESLWVALQLLETNSFNINFIKRTGSTGYIFESDNFSKTTETVQLNADCSLDTDNDGIADYLDTDSDNDGCPDALEGEKNQQTTATLSGGSNGGSSANLGTRSNKNGIPFPFGTNNGNQTKGQNNTTATKTAEKITVTNNDFTAVGNLRGSATITVAANAVATNTFSSGKPNYEDANSTNTTESLSYKWYKKTNPNNRLSTKKTLTLNNLNFNNAGEYIVEISGANNKCIEEKTFTLTVNDLPKAQDDWGNVTEDSTNRPINVLSNDSFGNDGANKGAIVLVSETSENKGTVSVDNNNTPNDPKDDKLLFSPFPNFFGRDTFQYTITDANGDSSTATVSIWVNEVNDVPIAKTDTAEVDEDSKDNKIIVTENDDFGGDGPNKGKIAIYNTRTKQKGSVKVDDNGTPKDPTDDAVLYTPAKSFNGTDEFSYVIIDNNGSRDEAKVTVTVKAINDLPTAANDEITVAEDAKEITINVLANDSFGDDGANSGSIELVKTTSEKGGTLSVKNNNTANNPEDDSIIYTPASNFFGEDSFQYKIKDADDEEAIATVTITVTAVNDNPAAVNDIVSTNEDTSAKFSVLANDSFGGDGPNSGKIVLANTSSTENGTLSVDDNGTSTDPTDDKINYTPAANFNGKDSFEYTIIDADGDTSTAKVDVTVNSVNDTPTVADDSITVDEDSKNNSINVLTNDSFGGDGFSENTTIEIDLTNSSGTATVDKKNTNSPTDDVILYSPAENFNGTDTFKYTITDANGDEATATVTVTINAVNDTPTATNDTAATKEDNAITINVTANDSFGGDGASSTSITLPSATSTQNGTLSVDNNGTTTDPTDDKILYTPATFFNGTDSFTYSISDVDGDTSTATVTIVVDSVNNLPNASNDTITIEEDASATVINVTANDNFGGDGANTGKISLAKTTSTKKGTLSIDDNSTATDPTDDKILYTPAADYNGTDTFTYTITDANGDSSTATVTVTINAVNDLPTALDDTFTVNEDSSRKVILIFENDSYGGDGKPSRDYLEVGEPDKGGSLLVRASRGNRVSAGVDYDIIYYTPAADFYGVEKFSYTITDTNGDKATATVTINVTNVNDTPTAKNDAYSVDEDSTASFTVVANDSFGGDGANTGTISLVNNTSEKNGTLTIDDNGTASNPADDKINYTPALNFNGADAFEYTITDADGDTSTAKVSITVNPINDLPTATNDTVDVDEDSTDNSISVTSNDNFGGDGANTGKIILPATTTAENGVLTVDDNGTENNPTDDKINYTPSPNFNGLDSFEYIIVDANGDRSTAEVTINVASVNDNPLAENDVAEVDEDTTNNNLNVAFNDDFGGDGPNSGSITLASSTSTNNGTISVDDNNTPNDPTDDNIVYSPALNFNGTDSFSYTITDSNGDTSSATVTITVNSINDVATASADIATVNEDSNNNSIIVLDNDNFGGDGASTGTISVESSSTSKNGVVTVFDNNTPNNPTDDTILYTPATNFNGTDDFFYTITDSDGDTATAKVVVTVTAVNDLPTSVNDAYTLNEDATETIFNVTENDDFGGDGPNSGTIVLSKSLSEKNGTITIDDNGTATNPKDDNIKYAPAADFNGPDSFTYTIIDANGDTSEATVTITINAVNDLPEAVADIFTVNEDSSNNSLAILTNDSFGGDGFANEAIVLANSTSTNGATLSVDDNATPNNPTDDKIIYTPSQNFAGVDSFEYSIKDANGDVATATVTINVSPSGTLYNPLAAVECFNIFVKNNLALSKGSTSGSIAVGKNLSFTEDYTLASEECGCFAVNDVKIGLLVGGKVDYPDTGILSIANENQYIKIGEDNKATAWYQDPDNSFSPIRITALADYNASANIQLTSTANSLDVSRSKNPVFQKNIIDFDRVFQQLYDVSKSLSQENSNTTLLNETYEEIPNNNLPSKIAYNLNTGVNYVNISGEDLNKVSTVEYFEKASSDRILIINVDAEGTFNWNVYEQTNISMENSAFIIYNFYNTTNLNIVGNNDIFGSILAPKANLIKTENAGNINGQIVANDLQISNGAITCQTFESTIHAPKDNGIAPTGLFSVNDNNQCLNSNEFIITNTSNTNNNVQPTAPLSYLWDFGDGTTSSLMNPTKTYDEAGTYTIKLTTKNSYGSSEETISVEVTGIIVADVVESNSIIDEDAGTVTKEFTLNNDTDFTSFSWALTDQGTNLFENEKTVSFVFDKEGEYTLTLTTFNGECANTTDTTITITSEEVSTGNDGGLESVSLGGALSKRYIQRKKNSIPTIFKKTSDIVYNKQKLMRKQVKKSNDLTMLEMFPDELVVGDIAHVTSPTDILDFTVAAEVLSVDFSVNDKTIGVILGVKTLDQIYNHTKATCDRLRGAEILSVKTVEIEGYNFLQQAIQQRDGVIEHAISFAVSKNNNEEFYQLQTNWYVFDYLPANNVFNFQVWASDPVNTHEMVKRILANINNYKPLQQTEKQRFPTTFATKVKRVADKLEVDLVSLNDNDDVEMSITEKLTETTPDLNSRFKALNASNKQTIELTIDDGYEYDGDIISDDNVQDAFYHADGNWGLDYDRRYTTVQKYEVTNNLNRVYKDDELPVNRNVHVTAYSEYDYLSVFKALLPGNLAADYSEYKYLSFKASGQGPTRITLVKSSIEKWADQFSVTVNLTDEEQTFFVPFSSLTTAAKTETIVADDLTSIAFTYIAVDAGTNDLDLKISDVKFTKTNSALSTDTFINPKKNEFYAYPNPSLGNINCDVYSEVATEAEVILHDVTGKTIYKESIKIEPGKNEFSFNFRKAKAGVNFLKIRSRSINYGTSKIIFK